MKRCGALRFMAAIVMTAALTGCGADASTVTETAESTEIGDVLEETDALEAGGEEADAEPVTAEAEISDTVEAKPEEQEETVMATDKFGIEVKEVPDNEGFRFTSTLGAGWILGNTFDAYMDTGLDKDLSDELITETCWQGVKTTREAIQGVKDAGFSTIRIPVSWHNHLIGDDYTISPVWLDRVNEVVDWALDAGLNVIINIHHDNHPDAGAFYPDSEHLEQSKKYISSIWSQVAERFKDYGDDLIFEGMNEPRLVDHENEWWFSVTAPPKDVKDAVACINELNQTFVDAVRSVEGAHRTCFLMCPGYDASADGALVAGFELPKDAEGIEDHIIVSVHAYTPYDFALKIDGTDAFDSSNASDTHDIRDFIDKLYNKYIKNGIPVVIGEFGALDKSGNLPARVDYTEFYSAYAHASGMPCLWWDNNAFEGSGELFGIYDREKCEFVYPEIKDALVEGQ